MTDLITDHRFTGLRQWGLNPPADARCQYVKRTETGHRPLNPIMCGMPKGAHHVPCNSGLNIKGEAFSCDWPTDENGEHKGWAHTNKAAQAVWGEGHVNVGLDDYRKAVRGVDRDVDMALQSDPKTPILEFLRWAHMEDLRGLTYEQKVDRYLELKGQS